ncbi:hypothetical protein AAU61_05730 [Desulfocarbo indianensis]|nr:hypothetical protein AAU61_05730 [Desulfocarbo indianensis]
MWKEIIRVRLPLPDAKQAGKDFWEVFNLAHPPKELASFQVYVSHAPENEVMLMLEWDSKGPIQGGSDLGRSLLAALKPYGRVELSTWTKAPMPGNGQ